MRADFSENYSFVLQDAAQGFHWNNSQETIHPFVAYYMKSGELLALFPGHSQILSRSCGENSGEGMGAILHHGPEMVDSVST